MNPKLVTWDYGKDINLNLEDAVISWEEMRILMGAEMKNGSDTNSDVKIYKNAEYTFAKDVQDGDVKFPATAEGQSDKTESGVNAFPLEANKPTEFRWINLTNGKRGQQDTFAKAALETGVENRVRFFWEEKAAENNEAYDAKTLVISPNKYPGTYRVVGDALIRSEKDGHDYAFQFVINKAKLMSEVTLTMQAEGDPSTNLLNVEVKAA